MKSWFKSLFCKHHYKATGKAEPISFFGIALWSQWDVECTLCGKKKFSVDIDKVKDWEDYNKLEYKKMYDEHWHYKYRVEKQPMITETMTEIMTLYPDGTLIKEKKQNERN